MKRKRIPLNQYNFQYVGKESTELEQSMVLGILHEHSIEYVNFQSKIRECIRNLSLQKAMEIGISYREYYYLQNKTLENLRIKLSKKILSKLASIWSFHTTK